MASSTPSNTNSSAAAVAAARPAAGRPQASHPSPYPIYHQQQQQQQPHYLHTSINTSSPNLPPIRSQTLIPPSNSPPPPHNSNNHHGILYPLASSGRGFIPPVPTRPSSDHNLLPRGSYNSSSSSLALSNFRAASPSPLSHPHYPHPPAHRLHPSLPNPHYHQSPPPVSAPIMGVPVVPQLKVAPSPVSDSNGYKHTRDTSDDPIVMVRGRKVVVTEGASIYGLCRSWLRNGVVEKSQMSHGEGGSTLPRPLPLPVVDSNSPSKEAEEEEDAKEAEESVEHLSAQDLLKRHVKHAKKVRARLREERLNRIARYKTRLALLLPPQVEQLRNDSAGGH
ncbi:hypothetical protein LINPERHAP2_LOCUS28154 [Linum perenne]